MTAVNTSMDASTRTTMQVRLYHVHTFDHLCGKGNSKVNSPTSDCMYVVSLS